MHSFLIRQKTYDTQADRSGPRWVDGLTQRCTAFFLHLDDSVWSDPDGWTDDQKKRFDAKSKPNKILLARNQQTRYRSIGKAKTLYKL